MGLGANEEEFTNKKYKIPKHIGEQIEHFSWEKIIEMSSHYSAKIESRDKELRKYEKQLNLMHLILMERIREQHKEPHIEPKLLIDLIKLLEHSEKISRNYDVDLENFNSYLHLIIHKIKKHKLAHIKHEKRNEAYRYKPIDEDRLHKIRKKKK